MKLLLAYIFRAALLLAAAGFGSLFADNIIEMRKLDARVKAAEAEVAELQRQNLALIAEAAALEKDPFYIELTLRRKLRWVRPGEKPVGTVEKPRENKPSSTDSTIRMAGDGADAEGEQGAATSSATKADMSARIVASSGGRLGPAGQDE